MPTGWPQNYFNITLQPPDTFENGNVIRYIKIITRKFQPEICRTTLIFRLDRKKKFKKELSKPAISTIKTKWADYVLISNAIFYVIDPSRSRNWGFCHFNLCCVTVDECAGGRDYITSTKHALDRNKADVR